MSGYSWWELPASRRAGALKAILELEKMERAQARSLRSDADEGRGTPELREAWRRAARKYDIQAATLRAAIDELRMRRA
jgi:hypothetical protein